MLSGVAIRLWSLIALSAERKRVIAEAKSRRARSQQNAGVTTRVDESSDRGTNAAAAYESPWKNVITISLPSDRLWDTAATGSDEHDSGDGHDDNEEAKRAMVKAKRMFNEARRTMVKARRTMVKARRMMVKARRTMVKARTILIKARRILRKGEEDDDEDDDIDDGADDSQMKIA